MATLAQLQAEIWYRAEFIPPNLRILVEDLQAFYGLGWSHIGCKGDENHLRGYHRSRAWILGSRYCTNRTYSVSRTPGDRSGGDPNWLCAIDATLPREKLLAACKRLDAAVRAGKLEKVVEWYGNTNGDSRVDGYDNIANAVASSDSSHLWHLHMSFDRGRADEDHTDLYEILTGVDMEQTEKLIRPTGRDQRTVGDTFADLQNLRNWLYSPADGSAPGVNPPPEGSVAQALLRREVTVKVEIGPESFTPEVLAAIAKAVNDGAFRRMAE